MTSIVGLLVLLAVGGAIVKAVGRGASGGTGAQPETTGLFVFLAMYIALLTFAIGLSGVVTGIVDRPSAGRAISAGEVSSVVIGLPVFVALARTVLGRLRTSQDERGGNGWSLYINVSLVTTLAVAVTAIYRVLDGILDGSRVGTEIGLVVVWAPLWALHWWAWNRFGDTRRPDVYWLLGSTGGVVMATVGGVWVLATAVRRIFDALGEPTVAVRATADDVEHALVVLVIGAAVWWWHWLRTGNRRVDSPARLTYLLIVGVFGGVVLMYVGAVGTLVSVLVWFFGEPDTTSARVHFDAVAVLVPLAVAGAALWWYHRTTLGPRRDADRTETDRLYSYLVAGIAAIVTTGSLITLGVVVLSLLAPADAVSRDVATGNIVLATIALLVFGGPTWFFQWRDLERRVAVDEAEARSRVRRLYLLVMLAIAGTVAFAAGIATLSTVLGAMTGERSGSVAGNLRVPLASLVGAAGLGVYHLRRYRVERHLFERDVPREVTIVVPRGTDIAALEQLPGVVITRLETPANGAAVDLDAVEAAIRESESDRLLVVTRGESIEAIPLA